MLAGPSGHYLSYWRRGERCVRIAGVRTLVLYPFRFRDRITGKWVRARHKLQYPELQRRYVEWEVTGAPEIRNVTPGPIEHFNPFKAPASRVCIAPMLLWTR